FFNSAPRSLPRPQFLGIVSSATLAIALAKKASGHVDGFVVEGPTAGGHNAPPRGPLTLSANGEPVYGDRDQADLKKIRDLGLPFWLAGSFGRPGKLAEALRQGATGIQVGTAFAFCEESGITPDFRTRLLAMSGRGQASVFTDPKASPTGFPFKVAQLQGTLSDTAAYKNRQRICDLGYLRHIYRKTDGTLGYRCPAEPINTFLRKGGVQEDTVGRKCVCNGLTVNVDLGQARSEGFELALITAGDDIDDIASFLPPGRTSYTAADVIQRLMADTPESSKADTTSQTVCPA
ncbi:MAG TPA: nitronate monooxygenase, partial [Clostridia bacterium]|nr:nitronate monooxygenase [Clostridia bacterium]